MGKKRWIRCVGVAFLILGAVFSVFFALPVQFDPNPWVWLKPAYYTQFLPVAVSVMLFICGALTTFKHARANFNLAVFGHTAAEEVIFHMFGWTQSILSPVFLGVFFVLAAVALLMAYSNWLGQKKLSVGEAMFSVVFGALVVYFFN